MSFCTIWTSGEISGVAWQIPNCTSEKSYFQKATKPTVCEGWFQSLTSLWAVAPQWFGYQAFFFFLNFGQNSSSRQKTQLSFNIRMDSLALNNKADNFIWSLDYRISLFEIRPEKHYLIALNNQPQWAPREHLCPGLFWDSYPNGPFTQK